MALPYEYGWVYKYTVVELTWWRPTQPIPKFFAHTPYTLHW